MMVRRTLVLVLEIVGGLVAGIAVLLGLFFWRLSQGPVSLDFLEPMLRAEVERQGDGQGVRLRVGEIVLTWEGLARPLEIRARRLTADAGAGDAPRPVAEGWIRPKAPGSVRDAAFLAACVDAWWPASYAQAAAPRPMATIAFTFQPLGAFDGLDPDAPLAYRARVDALRDGYAVELRELWGEDGRLLALNQQTICLIA